MGRSSWKPFFIGKDFIQQFTISNENTVSKKQDTENQENGFTKIQHLPKIDDLIIYNRGTVIRQYMVGLKVQVYNGIRFFFSRDKFRNDRTLFRRVRTYKKKTNT